MLFKYGEVGNTQHTNKTVEDFCSKNILAGTFESILITFNFWDNNEMFDDRVYREGGREWSLLRLISKLNNLIKKIFFVIIIG